MLGTFLFPKVRSASRRRGATITRMSLLPIAAVFFLVSGCASLPDAARLQNNMDAMVHYMGIMAGNMPAMAYSTGRMAEIAEKMERKSDTLLGDLQKKGGTAERIVQNYSQALLDNERAMINNLKGIRQELGDLKQHIAAAGRTSRAEDQDRVNSALMTKLTTLENRLSNLSSKLEQNGATSKH